MKMLLRIDQTIGSFHRNSSGNLALQDCITYDGLLSFGSHTFVHFCCFYSLCACECACVCAIKIKVVFVCHLSHFTEGSKVLG